MSILTSLKEHGPCNILTLQRRLNHRLQGCTMTLLRERGLLIFNPTDRSWSLSQKGMSETQSNRS